MPGPTLAGGPRAQRFLWERWAQLFGWGASQRVSSARAVCADNQGLRFFDSLCGGGFGLGPAAFNIAACLWSNLRLPHYSYPMSSASARHPDLASLDALTQGAFTAPTSGERSARIRAWLATDPSAEAMQDVFRELSARDKGAAKPVRERLDELRRARGQEQLAHEWAERAQALLNGPRLNIADALAWQRDAARAGAPLSREPLAELKLQMAERVKGIEDLQHRVQVHREAAVLLAQRIEVLSTKSWRDAQAVQPGLMADLAAWHTQADTLTVEPHWVSVDMRFAPLLEASRKQLQVVRDAFDGALSAAVAADADAQAPLPPVSVWADEIRQARGVAEPAAVAKSTARPGVAPAVRQLAEQTVQTALDRLQTELAQGHGRASSSAAGQLRGELKKHGAFIGPALDAAAQAALAAASELDGWQRWRANQLREELIAKAEALNGGRVSKEAHPAPTGLVSDAVPPEAGAAADAPPVPVAPSESNEPPEPENKAQAATENVALEGLSQASTDADEAAANQGAVDPAAAGQANAVVVAGGPARARGAQAAPQAGKAMPGGRKLQDALRQLRDAWKEVDQAAPPNFALRKRFDAACNLAHQRVQTWLDQTRAQAAEHSERRRSLIAEVRAWGEQAASRVAGQPAPDWKGFARDIHAFSERWRTAGHVAEKAFDDLQKQWRDAIHAAAQPLELAQQASMAARQGLIADAQTLAETGLRMDMVRSLQQRWQAEAQRVPLDRKLEQKMWEAFRGAIDAAFAAKSAERERAQSAISERDREILALSKAVDDAVAGGDARVIQAAVAALNAALASKTNATKNVAFKADNQGDRAGSSSQTEVASAAPSDAPAHASSESPSDAPAHSGATAESGAPAAADAAAAAVPAPAKPKPVVVARRGDDRPASRTAAAPVRRDGHDGREGRGDGRHAKGPMRPGGRDGGRERGRDGGRDGAARSGPGGAGFGAAGGPRGDRFGRPDRFESRDDVDRAPRLGDAAFRAQREAHERAEAALRKMAAQAHGEALAQVLSAWAVRDAGQLPPAADLGRLSAGGRQAWQQALARAAGASPAAEEALLRLEMAAEVPTPASHLNARRLLQLQLLTRRHDPPPAATWERDAAQVLASPSDAQSAQRLQSALKALLRRP
jgi:ATP-dependent RNA helicase SUPV3L1/SUV3